MTKPIKSSINGHRKNNDGDRANQLWKNVLGWGQWTRSQLRLLMGRRQTKCKVLKMALEWTAATNNLDVRRHAVQPHAPTANDDARVSKSSGEYEEMIRKRKRYIVYNCSQFEQ
jgi:hypothetical protein